VCAPLFRSAITFVPARCCLAGRLLLASVGAHALPRSEARVAESTDWLGPDPARCFDSPPQSTRLLLSSDLVASNMVWASLYQRGVVEVGRGRSLGPPLIHPYGWGHTQPPSPGGRPGEPGGHWRGREALGGTRWLLRGGQKGGVCMRWGVRGEGAHTSRQADLIP
jgi:hypothetical protein